MILKVYQLVPWISDGDGVSNCVFYLNETLNSMGFDSAIFSKSGTCRGDNKNSINNVVAFKDIGISEEDVVFFHYSGATDCILELEDIQCKKILVFQNVSNPELYRKTDWRTYSNLALGVEEARHTHLVFDRAITLSDYSKQNLIEYGWSEDKIDIIPIIPLPDNARKYDEGIISKYCDGKKNFIHIGRIAPNKKIEDIIHIFEYYQKNIDKNTRLLLVGCIQFENYYRALQRYIDEQKINNVEITGSASQEEIEAYYKIADLYLCMSEHEGFCLPIIESFQRDVPVVAYNSTAVPYTMGGAGILVNTKEPSNIGKVIKHLLTDDNYRALIIEEQKKRALGFQIFSYTDVIRDVIEKTSIVERRVDFSLEFQNKILYNTVKKNPPDILDYPYVIYGYGKAGKHLVKALTEREKKNLMGICDNNISDTECVVGHFECLQKNPTCNYILTMQKGYIPVIESLIEAGISGEKIFFYSYSDNSIYQ